jgi:hypothetical protein
MSMADEVDLAAELQQLHLEQSLRAARAVIPAGALGECSECGEDMPRLIGGRCAPCRDGRTWR